jgi:peptidoglycan hydrolase-like protein with peptidoglycan-binding domain
MQTMWSASVWSATTIGVPGDGDVAPRRESDVNVPAAGGGAPPRDGQVQRPPFIREAQRALRDLGYHPGPIDGMFGPQTRLALQKYQQAEKLPVTGQLDAETMERLDVYKRLFRPVRER